MKYIFLITFVMLLSVPLASYGAMRCGQKLVGVGDTKGHVKLWCGAPDSISKETIEIAQPGRSKKKSQVVEIWTYNMGDKQLVKVLHFQGSRLVRTEEGGYGTGAPRQFK